MLQKITETSIPHQTAADGVQYAVSTKAFAKDDYVTDNDVNEKTEDKEVCVFLYTTYVTLKGGDFLEFLKFIPRKFLRTCGWS